MIKGKMTETAMEMTLKEYMLWVAFEKRTVWTSTLLTLLAACLFNEAAAEDLGWFLVLTVAFFVLTIAIQVVVTIVIAGTVDSS